jgi:hypothetical protein
MRLIDADALDYELGTSDRDIYVRECLAEAPSVTPEPHWIPVTERLPEEDGRYLVCGAKGGIYHANYRGGWWTQVGCGGKLVPSVVAWMPLPEPYKGVTT